MIKKETEMLDDSSQKKPPQKTFIHYAILEGLEQINTFSHFLIAIQASKHEVEQSIIAGLAFLICEKTKDIKNVMEEMSKENRPIGLG